MVWYALLFVQVPRLSGGAPVAVGGMIMMVQLPTILFAGLSGMLVDRFSKHHILVFSNVMRTIGCIGYVAFLNNVPALYAITFFVAVVNQPFQPAESATIPILVSERLLLPANALFQITFLCSQAVGYVAGPILVGFPAIGVRNTVVISAAFLTIAAAVLIGLPPITRERRKVADAESAQHALVQMWMELVEVARAVARDSRLAVALIQLSLAPAVLLVLGELGPKYVTQLMATSQYNAMIWLIAPAGAGLGVGMFLIDRIGHRIPKGRLASAALIASGLALGALAVVPNVTGVLLSYANVSRTLGAVCMTVPISFVLGIAASLLVAPAQTIVQERADANLRGRVLAVQQAIAAAVIIPPLIAVAAVGQVLSISETMGILAAVVVIAGLLSRRAAV
jgi:MFS family permease